MKNILFCGGGTGGHVFPIKSLIDYILNNEEIYGQFKEIFWCGEANSLEEKISNQIKDNKFKFIPIKSGKLRRDISVKSIILNFFDLFSLFFGFIQSVIILLYFKVDTIFCKGGYVALPIVLAGKILGKQIIVHESDTVPGLANRISSKFATTIYSGFPGVLKNSIYVGQILSNDILNFQKGSLPILSKEKTNVMVIGGSQGAKTLYESLFDAIKQDVDLQGNYKFIVILGTQNTYLKTKFDNLDNVDTVEFASQNEIGYLLNNVDLVISRGGATSLAEIKSFGLPIIIVPLPYTGGNHQYYNGLHYEKEYNDILVKQDDNLTNNLISSLKQFNKFKHTNKLKPNYDIVKKIIIEGFLE